MFEEGRAAAPTESSGTVRIACLFIDGKMWSLQTGGGIGDNHGASEATDKTFKSMKGFSVHGNQMKCIMMVILSNLTFNMRMEMLPDKVY